MQLKIAGNSTRRARWDTKLGFYKHPWPFLLHLDSLKENGGLVSRLGIHVLRVYPIMFVLKQAENDNQKTVFRSEKVHRKLAEIERGRRLDRIETLHNRFSLEVQKEHELQRKKIQPPRRKLKDIDDPEELWQYYEYSKDPDSVEVLNRRNIIPF